MAPVASETLKTGMAPLCDDTSQTLHKELLSFFVTLAIYLQIHVYDVEFITTSTLLSDKDNSAICLCLFTMSGYLTNPPPDEHYERKDKQHTLV